MNNHKEAAIQDEQQPKKLNNTKILLGIVIHLKIIADNLNII